MRTGQHAITSSQGGRHCFLLIVSTVAEANPSPGPKNRLLVLDAPFPANLLFHDLLTPVVVPTFSLGSLQPPSDLPFDTRTRPIAITCMYYQCYFGYKVSKVYFSFVFPLRTYGRCSLGLGS